MKYEKIDRSEKELVKLGKELQGILCDKDNKAYAHQVECDWLSHHDIFFMEEHKFSSGFAIGTLAAQKQLNAYALMLCNGGYGEGSDMIILGQDLTDVKQKLCESIAAAKVWEVITT